MKWTMDANLALSHSDNNDSKNIIDQMHNSLVQLLPPFTALKVSSKVLCQLQRFELKLRWEHKRLSACSKWWNHSI